MSSTLPVPASARAASFRWLLLAVAIGAGFAVGWADRTATEVQGPLLLLMAAAFLLSIPRAAPAWAVAIATFVGLPLAHLVGRALGDAQGASFGMIIALVPTAIAAYAGAGAGAIMHSASALVDRRIAIAGVLMGCAAVGLGPTYATLVARGQPFAWWVAILWQLVSLVAWAAATPLVLRIWRQLHASLDEDPSPNGIWPHTLAAVGIAVLHAVLMPLGTMVLFIPLGATSIGGAIAWAFAAYLPLDLLTYGAVTGVAYAADAERRARAAATREGAARGELAVARLTGLRAQLRPHFLFNALNTASVLASRGDADGTRRVLSGLGDLLRYVMRGMDSPESAANDMVRLREEVEFIEQYLAIERERFPERLRTTIDVAPDVRDALVPALLLQPLVENAIKHGLGGRIGAGAIGVRAWRDGALLRVSVTDDGPGPSPNASTTGIGLANTKARLMVLYGSSATIDLTAADNGGAVASITIPVRM